MFRHAIYPTGSTCSGSVGALLYAPLWFSQNKAPFRVGFEPTNAGFQPAAIPLSYPSIAVDAFSLQGAFSGRYQRRAGSERLLYAPFCKQDTVFMHTGVEPAVPRLTAGCFPAKRMHRKCCCLCLCKARLSSYGYKSYALLLFVLLLTATLYDPFPGFSWKKSCELPF